MGITRNEKLAKGDGTPKEEFGELQPPASTRGETALLTSVYVPVQNPLLKSIFRSIFHMWESKHMEYVTSDHCSNGRNSRGQAFVMQISTLANRPEPSWLWGFVSKSLQFNEGELFISAEQVAPKDAFLCFFIHILDINESPHTSAEPSKGQLLRCQWIVNEASSRASETRQWCNTAFVWPNSEKLPTHLATI